MKILLTTLNAKYIHTSLALQYLKAYSEKDFKQISTYEFTINEPLTNMLSVIFEKKPNVLGVACYIWNIEETIKLIKLVKKVLPDTVIVLGGPEVSFDLRYWLNKIEEIDFIVYGEGEKTFNYLLKALYGDRLISEVSGIAYTNNEEIVINPPREIINLNDIPSPFSNKNIADVKDRIVYYESSRGCPFSCSYCLSSLDNKVRYFNIERVKIDLLNIINAGAKTVKFVDRTFNTNSKFALEIFEFIITNNRNTIFQFEITADIMNDELIDYLVNNTPERTFRFEIGVQTTNDRTNLLINRKQNFNKLKDVVLRLQKNKNIDLHLDLIAGLPDENISSFKKSFNEVFALNSAELQLGFLKILRGTLIWREAKKFDYVYMNNPPYEVLHNNVLSYMDVIKIKRVEDILEKYWNSHRMDRTIEYLINKEFASAFDFFEEFGDFWHEKSWNPIGYQIDSLFSRLINFLSSREIIDLEFVKDLMKLEYFLNHKNKPRKIWWDYKLSKQEQNAYFKNLVENPYSVTGNFEKLKLNEKDMHKHIMIDVLNYDLEYYLINGEMKKQKTLLIIYYNFKEKPEYYFKNID